VAVSHFFDWRTLFAEWGTLQMADGDPEDELDLDEELEPDNPDDATSEADEVDEPDNPDDPSQAEAAAGSEREQAPPERQPSRGENRFQTLRNENQTLKAEVLDTKRRLEEISRRLEQPRPQGETPAQRAERLSMMSPQEQIAETLREAEQRHEARINAMEFNNVDLASRTQFQAKAAVDPLYAKWGPKVEAFVAEQRAKGLAFYDRDIALALLIGKAALEKRTSKEGRAEVRQAARRVASQRTRPVNSGSDVPAQRRTGNSLERRLENQQI
jgi:hypothetical protein